MSVRFNKFELGRKEYLFVRSTVYEERRQLCRTRHFAQVRTLQDFSTSRPMDQSTPAFAGLLTQVYYPRMRIIAYESQGPDRTARRSRMLGTPARCYLAASIDLDRFQKQICTH